MHGPCIELASDWNADAMDCFNLTHNDMWLNLFVALALIRMYGAEPYSVVVTNGALDSMQVKNVVANVLNTQYACDERFFPKRSLYANTEDHRMLQLSDFFGYETRGPWSYCLKHEDPEKMRMDEVGRILPTRQEFALEFVQHCKAILEDPAQDVRTAVRASCFLYQQTTYVMCDTHIHTNENDSADEEREGSADDA